MIFWSSIAGMLLGILIGISLGYVWWGIDDHQ